MVVAAPPRASVLVVDDEPANLALVASVLRDRHDVRVANTGERALALARSAPPDLVLLDVEMPGMDGYAVCTALKREEPTRDAPVVFLTSRSSVEDEAHGFSLGAVDYMHKPLSPPLLVARVATHLALRAALRAAREEKRKADGLLEVVLPRVAADELRATATVKSRRIEGVAVMFCDIVGFTAWCERQPPEAVVRDLHAVFLRFEAIAREHGVEKLKTVGDGFMAAAGLLEPVEEPLLRAVRCALQMASEVSRLVPAWQLHSGVNVGPVVAGIVGGERYQFDVWGDTVNLAARLAGAATPGRVAVTAQAWSALEGKVQGQPLGTRTLKGKGELALYEVTGHGAAR